MKTGTPGIWCRSSCPDRTEGTCEVSRPWAKLRTLPRVGLRGRAFSKKLTRDQAGETLGSTRSYFKNSGFFELPDGQEAPSGLQFLKRSRAAE